MIEIIQPTDETHWKSLRTQDVTSTEVAALFGISPYTTLFELWHRKDAGAVVEIDVNERMVWGTRLQDAIALGVAEDNKWNVRKMPEYMRDSALRMGSSFDFSIEEEIKTITEDRPISMEAGAINYVSGSTLMKSIGVGLLEIKNVDSLAFRDGWLVDGENVEAPPHIEIQVQHQLGLTGRSFAYIGALVGGNRVVLIKREPDGQIIDEIKRRIKMFWESVASKTAPEPDFERDAEFVSKLYGYAQPGKIMDASGNVEIQTLATEYRRLGQIEKESGEQRAGIKAELLTKIGDAEKTLGDTFSISAGMIGPTLVEYERKGYRDFRIHWKKEKK